MPRRGNAGLTLPDVGPAPWLKWPEEPGSAAHCVRWIERYVRPPKGFGATRRIKLGGFQQDWIRSVLAPDVSAAALSLPRGNGKSTLLAAFSLWALFCPRDEGAPQVPIVARTVMQAMKSVYNVALAMIAAEPHLEQRSLVYSAWGNMRVVVPATGGEMFPAAADPAALQGLDPSVAVADELGFLAVASWDALLLASGKRPRSLVVGIGTPSPDRDNALWHLRKRVREGGVLPGFVYTEYAARDGSAITDETEWARANPALAEGFMNIKALRMTLAVTPAQHFEIYRLGKWSEGVDCWLGASGRSVWEKLRDPFELVAGAPTWVGVDIGMMRDSTAVVAVQRRDDGRWHVKARFWVPMPGVPVDVTDVMQHLRELHALYKLEEVSFDPRLFDVPAKMLADDGLPMVNVPQSPERMLPICGDGYELIIRGEVSHDGDETLDTHVLNAVARFDAQGRGFTLQKSKARGLIDGAIAMLLALGSARRKPKKPKGPRLWGDTPEENHLYHLEDGTINERCLLCQVVA